MTGSIFSIFRKPRNPAAGGERAFARNAVLAFTLFACAALGGCQDKATWHATDLTGSALPRLDFTMTRADDGKPVTEADYKGKVVLLYFGYTFCPDVCPLTLANTVQVLQKLGKSADDVRVLFVTVDPGRDSLSVLKQYTDAFAPQIDGLRGTADELATLAKRYRVAYSVKASANPADYTVTHSSAVYVFDRQGNIRLLFSTLHENDPDIDGYAADLKRLLEAGEKPGLFAWLDSFV